MQYMTKEWTVILVLRELELQREAEIAHNRFHDKPDERGWITHTCCGTICALRSTPPLKLDYKEWHGGHPR